MQYVFAVVGVLLYAGRFERLSTTQGRYPEYLTENASFDSFESSLTIMFQLLIGEGWHEVMFAAVDSKRGSMPHAMFFIIYVVLSGIIATNLFIGIICEAFRRLQELRQNIGIRAPTRKEFKRAMAGDRFVSSSELLQQTYLETRVSSPQLAPPQPAQRQTVAQGREVGLEQSQIQDNGGALATIATVEESHDHENPDSSHDVMQTII